MIAVLINPNNPDAATQSSDVEAAARAVGQQIQILYAGAEREIDAAFATLVQRRAGALLVAGDPNFISRREQLAAPAERHGIPANYELREFAVAGGLMSYGTSLADAYRQVGVYAGRILKGAKPADLPVVRPTNFELVINLKAAKAIGIAIPADAARSSR
jgi:putative ABC transport system substrate-binding protein